MSFTSLACNQYLHLLLCGINLSTSFDLPVAKVTAQTEGSTSCSADI